MDRKAFIKSCHRQGLTYVQIAKVLGVSRQRVEQLLRPEKRAARERVAEELNRESCEYPNCSVRFAQAHHPDYSKPLDVIWLCQPHHKKLHLKPKIVKKKIRRCLYCGKEVVGRAFYCGDDRKKRINKQQRTIYKENPTRRVRMAEATKKWKELNPDRVKAINYKAVKIYRDSGKRKVQRKLWYARNREKILSYNRARYREKREKLLNLT
jgi:hypothetical protein